MCALPSRSKKTSAVLGVGVLEATATLMLFDLYQVLYGKGIWSWSNRMASTTDRASG